MKRGARRQASDVPRIGLVRLVITFSKRFSSRSLLAFCYRHKRRPAHPRTRGDVPLTVPNQLWMLVGFALFRELSDLYQEELLKRFFAMLMCFVAVPAVAQEVEVGDTVLAHWEQANAYFVGTAVEEHGSSLLIVFEDGDIAEVSKLKIFKNDITVGSRVIARWKGGRYYPGIVARIVGRALYIHYDDGDKGWAPWSGVAVSEIPPSTTNTETALSDSAPVATAQDGDVTLRRCTRPVASTWGGLIHWPRRNNFRPADFL